MPRAEVGRFIYPRLFNWRIMELSEIYNNGGLCPFFWQEFGVFLEVAVAESCRWPGLGLALHDDAWRVHSGSFASLLANA